MSARKKEKPTKSGLKNDIVKKDEYETVMKGFDDFDEAILEKDVMAITSNDIMNAVEEKVITLQTNTKKKRRPKKH